MIAVEDRVRQRAGRQIDPQTQHEIALVVRHGGGAEIHHQITCPGRRHPQQPEGRIVEHQFMAAAPAPDRRATRAGRTGRAVSSGRALPAAAAKRASQSPSIPTRRAAGGSTAPKPSRDNSPMPRASLHPRRGEDFQPLRLDRLDQRALVPQQARPTKLCIGPGSCVRFRRHRVRSRTAPRRVASRRRIPGAPRATGFRSE